MDLIECNEAFAAMVLACQQELDMDPNITNVYGGAVALGHPIGMSGARILMTLIYALKERDGHYGLANICGNGGHGAAMVIEMM
jgi:acetyl-CoA C-acetyltransferase